MAQANKIGDERDKSAPTEAEGFCRGRFIALIANFIGKVDNAEIYKVYRKVYLYMNPELRNGGFMLSITRPTYRCRREISVTDGTDVISPEQFLRMANHELRSPLTAMRVQSQLGKRYLERGNAQRAIASLSTIEEQSFHMERMLRDLLDAAKMAQGHFIVQHVRTNLVKVCERSIAAHRTLTGRTIVTHLPSNPILLPADPDALGRLFEHLLLNAALYSPDNSPIELSLVLVANAGIPDQQALISVRDEGYGIATEELTSIFEMFYRGYAGHESALGGLGLGLALCKEIAHLHHGDIWVTSQRPGGSTFFVRLPVGETL